MEQDENLKKLLMITWLFPPLGGSGALRPLKLARYLPRYGWRPMVLTVKNPDWYYAIDPDLMKQLPPEVPIFRTPMIRSAWGYRLLNPLRNRRLDHLIRCYLMHPDEQLGWIPFAWAKAKTLVRAFKPQAIYSTSGPMSCHLIAHLVKRKTAIPWIAEFRDEWLENPDLALPTQCHYHFHRLIEQTVVRSADAIVGMAPYYTDRAAKHLGPNGLRQTITAGFDPDDIPTTSPSHRNHRFTLVYAGLFYESFPPDHLVQAVYTLIRQHRVAPDKIRIRFVGANPPGNIPGLDPYRICQFLGFLPRHETMKIIAGADALLLLLSQKRGKNVIPSKLFEYMASGKPILALVPENGDAADLIRKTRTGNVVDYENRGQIPKTFFEFYQCWENNVPIPGIDPDRQLIEEFHMNRIAQKWSRLLDQVRWSG